MRLGRAGLVIIAALATGCGAMIPPGTPPQIPRTALFERHGGVLISELAEARLNGILSKLVDAGAPMTGHWSAIPTISGTPQLDALEENRLLVSRGMIQLAADEAQMAGMLAVTMVEARLAYTEEIPDLPADAAAAALDLPLHRRDIRRRLTGFAGSETGNPARTALSLVAAAGYDPAALAEVAAALPPDMMRDSKEMSLEELEAALPSVQREFPSADRRNTNAWKTIRDSIDTP